MSGYSSLAYVMQLNLPGGPIKIGNSCRVRERFHNFNGCTPVDLRIVGVTYPGTMRELKMLEATAATVIKGEWRYATPQLRELIAEWVEAGEWHVESGDRRAHFIATEVESRAEPFLSPRHPIAYPRDWNAHEITAKAGAVDPSLLADWHGFARATEAPDFHWPMLKQARAA